MVLKELKAFVDKAMEDGYENAYLLVTESAYESPPRDLYIQDLDANKTYITFTTDESEEE